MTTQEKTIDQIFQYATLAEASYVVFDGIDNNNSSDVTDAMAAQNRLPKAFGDTFFDPAEGGTWSVVHTNEGDNNFIDGGFAASVFKNDAGEIVIGIRGTEPPGLGNLTLTDILADLGNIGGEGLAYRQATSLFNYIMRLKANEDDTVVQLDVIEVDTFLPQIAAAEIGALLLQGYQLTTIGGVPFMTKATYEENAGLGIINQGDTVITTGHSLGGHLAYIAKQMFSDTVSEAYGFNSAGYDPILSSQLTYEFMEFFSTYSLEAVNSFADVGQDIHLFDSEDMEPGDDTDIVSSTWITGKEPAQTQYVTTEVNSHAVGQIMDALALQTVFWSMNSDLSLDQLGAIINAAATPNGSSQEQVIGALSELLNVTGNDLVDYIPGVAGDDQSKFSDRVDQHDRIIAIKNAIDGRSLLVTSLVNMAVDDMVLNATSTGTDLAFIYALEHLNPFAITGDDSLYSDIDAADFSDNYLQDRALYLTYLSEYNLQSGENSSLEVRTLTALSFLDESAANGEDLTVTGGGLNAGDAAGIYFGSDAGNDILGTINGDRFYGFDGNDTLDSGEGADYIEGGLGDDEITGGTENDVLSGGEGSDTYKFTIGDGVDTIIDLVHAGDKIFIDDIDLSTLNFVEIAPGTGIYTDADFNENTANPTISILLVAGQLTISASQGGESTRIIINTFASGDFGIDTADAIVSEPPVIEGMVISQIETSPGIYETELRDSGTGNTIEDQGFIRDNYDLRYSGYNSTPILFNAADYASYSVDPPTFEIWRSTFGFFTAGGDKGDNLVGGSNPDYFHGYAGSDVIRGGSNAVGFDFIWGGAGSDFLYGGLDSDVIWGTANGFINLETNPNPDPTDARVYENVGDSDYIEGNEGDDWLSGGNYNDIILGGSENDEIYGGAGNDTLLGGAHDDEIYGDSRLDADLVVSNGSYSYTYSPAYIDSVAPGYTYNDWIDGGDGNDKIFGEAGDDVLLGGLGDDQIMGDSLLVDGDGNSIPQLEPGDDLIYGGAGNDNLWGAGGSDVIFGGEGHDDLNGDGIDYDPALHDNDSLHGGGGDDRLWGYGGDDELYGGSGNDQLVGDFSALDMSYHGNDRLDGGEGDDVLAGLGGDDYLIGGAGIDSLYGDEGIDTLLGGTEVDYLFGGSGSDALFGGEGNDQLDGEDDADALFGDAGDDIIRGGSGDDVLTGGLGNDTLRGDEGNDTYVYNLGDGNDYIDDTQGINCLILNFNASQVASFQNQSGTAAIILNNGEYIAMSSSTRNSLQVKFSDGSSLLANDFDQRVQLSEGDTTATTGSGNDVITGSVLADTIDSGAGDDVVYGDGVQATGDGDVIDGGAGNDELWGEHGDDILYGGDDNDYLRGEGGDDSLFGDGGNDALDGDVGVDNLSGGLGDDTYTVWLGEGDDIIDNTDAGDGVDTLILRGGASAASTSLTRDGDNLLVNTGSNVVTVTDHFKDYGTDSNRFVALDRIFFADTSELWTNQDIAVAVNLPAAVSELTSSGIDQVRVFSFASLLANDIPGSNGPLTIIAVGGEQNGTAELDAVAETITFTPAASFVGEASFDYTVSDSVYDLQATLTIEISNSAPVAVADSLIVLQDEVTVITFAELLTNDSDPDGQALNIVAVDNASNGSVVLDTLAQTIIFTPDAGYTGTASFDYAVSDGFDFSTTSVNLTVSLSNTAPTAVDDTVGAALNQTRIINFAELLANDSDADGDSLTIQSVGNAVNGSVSIDTVAETITFTPNSDFVGAATFDYTLSDGGLVSTATVSVDVLAGNLYIGTQGNDTYFGSSASENIYGLGGNDTLYGNGGADFLTGGLGDDYLAGGTGHDTYYYNLGDGIDIIEENFTTSLDTVNDLVFGEGISVPTSYASNGIYGAYEGIDLRFTGFFGRSDLLFNLEFADGTILPTNQSLPQFIKLADVPNSVNGGLKNDTIIGGAQDNEIRGERGDDYLVALGGNDVVYGLEGKDTLEIIGGVGASHTLFGGDNDDIYVLGTGAVQGSHSLADWNGVHRLIVDINAIDPASITLTKNGDDLVIDYGTGDLTIRDHFRDYSVYGGDHSNAFESIEFRAVVTETEFADAIPTLSWDKVVDDGSEADVVWDQQYLAEAVGLIWADKAAPMANDDYVVSEIDSVVTLSFADILANDSEIGDLAIVSVKNANNGSVEMDAVAETVTFTPTPGFTGEASFDYNVADISPNSGFPTGAARVHISVAAGNAPPVVSGESVSSNEDTVISFTFAELLANDTDADGDSLTIESVTNAINGAVTLDSVLEVVIFTPTANYNGTASFDYAVSDGTTSSTATVSIDVQAINDAPVLSNAISDQQVDEDSAFSFTVPGNAFSDVDTGDVLNYSATLSDDSPLPDWLSFDPATLTFSGTPGNDEVGSISVKVSASDGTDSVSDMFDIGVVNTNDAPEVVNFLVDQQANEDAGFSYTVPADAFDDIDAGDVLTYSAALSDDSPLPGWLSFDASTRTFSGVPENADVGSIDVRVTASDGVASISDIFSISVANTNDAPDAQTDALSTERDLVRVIAFAELLANDSDIDGDALSISAVGNAVNGTVSLDSVAQTISFTPDAGFLGAASFDYTLSDGVETAIARVDVDVQLPNVAPVPGDDSVTTNEDTAVSISFAELLGNDTDANGDSLTINSVSNAVNGTAVMNELAEAIEFTPDANFNGEASFEYSVSDGALASSATVTVTVNPQNDDPIPIPDSLDTAEDVPLVISFAELLANDSDIDGDVLDIVSASNAQNGNVVIDSVARTITFTPDANYHGVASFDYTASDGIENVVTTATINIAAVNDAPTAVGESVLTPSDVPVVLTFAELLANDSDIDGDALTIVSASNASNGTVVLDSVAQTITFTAAAGYTGPASFDYTVTDGYEGSSTSVSINVIGQNDAPVALRDSKIVVGYNEPRVIAFSELLANDFDLNGDDLTIESIDNVSSGVVELNSIDKTITITPDVDFTGWISFTYIVSDGLQTAETYVEPFVLDHSLFVGVGTEGDDTISGTDQIDTIYGNAGNDILGGSAGGDYLHGGSGADLITGSSIRNERDYITGGLGDDTLVGGFGFDSYYYNQGDGHDTLIDPVDTYYGYGGIQNSLFVGLSAGNPVSFAYDGVTARYEGLDIDFGGDTAVGMDVWIQNSLFNQSQVRYSSLSQFAQLGDEVTSWEAFDDSGNTIIGGAADTHIRARFATGDDYIVLQGGSDIVESGNGNDVLEMMGDAGSSHLVHAGFGNDIVVVGTGGMEGSHIIESSQHNIYGAQDDDRIIFDINQIDPSTVTLSRVADNLKIDYGIGDITVTNHFKEFGIEGANANALDRIEFRNLATKTDQSHVIETLSWDKVLYTQGDAVEVWNQQSIAEAAGLTWTVSSELVANSDAVSTLINNSITLNVSDILANDFDADGNTLVIDSVWNAHNGVVELDTGAQTITFTPDAGYIGAANFDYTVNDGTYTNTATVRISVVEEFNNPPIVVGESVMSSEDETLVFSFADLLANDTDEEGNSLTIASVGNASNGSVSIDSASASVTFTPTPNYNGAASFEYDVSDGTSTSTATVSIEIEASNDAPIAQDDSISTERDQVRVITFAELLANDLDVDGDTLSVTGVSNQLNGSVTIDNIAQTISFSPDAGYTGPASFDYTLSDGVETAIARVDVDVQLPNVAPVPGDDSVTTNEDTAVSISFAELLGNDTDANGDSLTINSVSNAVNGTAVINELAEAIEFTPDANFNGEASFEYSVSDGALASSATVTVTVNPQNDDPIPIPDSLDTAEDVPLVISFADLLANDGDIDGDVLDIVSVSNAQNGNVVIDSVARTITFTPDANYHGVASFDYTASDGIENVVTTATINIAAVNDAPTAVGESVLTPSDVPVVLTFAELLANDSDIDGDALTIVSANNESNGTVVLDSVAQTITFTAAAGYTGPASFDYAISDGGLTTEATVNVDVTLPNLAPDPGDDSVTTNEDTAVSISFAELLGNDTDANGDSLTINSVSNAVNGTAVINELAEAIEFTPDANFNGEASFEYSVSDGALASSATVTVTVNPQNDDPVPIPDSLDTAEDVPLVISFADLLANDGDIDGDVLDIVSVSNAQNGNVVIDSVARTITFTPDANYHGVASFDYTASDGIENVVTTATINVAAVNDAPTAVGESVLTPSDVPVVLTFAELLANDSDIDGDALTIVSANNESNGTVVLDSVAQTITFTPASGYSGLASFDYGVADGITTSSASVSVDVQVQQGVAPDVGNDVLYGQNNHNNTFDFAELLSNDIDYDGDAIEITDITTDGSGTLTVDFSTQQFTYIPGPGESNASFSYTLTDGVYTATGTAAMQIYDGTVLSDGSDDVDGSGEADVISGLDGDDKIEGKDGDDIVIGGDGDDEVKGDRGNDIVIGGLGNDTVKGGDGNDQLFGSSGDDTLKGEKGDDTYNIGLGDGHDTIDNNAKDHDKSFDVIQYESRVEFDDLWFSRQGDNLVIDVIGTNDQVTVKKWYAGDKHQIDQILTSTESLDLANIEQLVQAMAVFDPPVGVGAKIETDVAEELAPVLASSWQSH